MTVKQPTRASITESEPFRSFDGQTILEYQNLADLINEQEILYKNVLAENRDTDLTSFDMRALISVRFADWFKYRQGQASRLYPLSENDFEFDIEKKRVVVRMDMTASVEGKPVEVEIAAPEIWVDVPEDDTHYWDCPDNFKHDIELARRDWVLDALMLLDELVENAQIEGDKMLRPKKC